jgi:serine/threonine protein kinase/TolA-binding protein
MAGETLSHYRLIEKVGDGASGVIYKAEDLALGRLVGLKCLPAASLASGSSLVRFQHEARTASSINHPNICTIHEIGEQDERQFIVMEWLDGQTLAQAINGRPMKLDELVELGIQIADGLSAAHDEGVIHRDVKPANIFVTNKGQAKVLDFGISLLVPRTHSVAPTAGLPAGTTPYMSPEQVRGDDLDARSDLFSLGTVLYEMATGRHPFAGGTAAEIMQHILNRAPDPPRVLNPRLPAELDRIVMKALEKSRKLRFQTASDLRVDLQRLKREMDSGAWSVNSGAPLVVASRSPAPSNAGGRMLVLAALAIAVFVIVIAGVIAKRDALPEDRGGAAAEFAVLRQTGRTDITLEPSRSGTLPRKATAPPVEPEPAPGANDAGRIAPLSAVDSINVDRELSVAQKKADAGLYDQALETVRNLLAKHSGSIRAVDAYFVMGSIHERQQRYEDAMATYLEIAERYPRHERAGEALYRLADVTMRSKRRGKEIEARQVLERIVASFPATSWAPQALMMKAELEQRQRLYQRDAILGTSVPAALVTYRTLIENYPGAAGREVALQKIGKMYADARRYDLAAAAFADLGTTHPTHDPDAWFHAGEIYRRRLKNPQMARDAYTRVSPASRYFKDAQNQLK